jgi:hypothetical protein
MAETAALLVDEVLPQVPYRQSVLRFPFPLRFLLSRRPDLLSTCLQITHRAIGCGYKRRAKRQGHGWKGDLKMGSVTFIQRFGSTLNLNPHFHMLFAVRESVQGKHVPFHRTPIPTDEDVAQLVETIRHRILRALKRRGYAFDQEGDHQRADTEEQPKDS